MIKTETEKLFSDSSSQQIHFLLHDVEVLEYSVKTNSFSMLTMKRWKPSQGKFRSWSEYQQLTTSSGLGKQASSAGAGCTSIFRSVCISCRLSDIFNPPVDIVD